MLPSKLNPNHAVGIGGEGKSVGLYCTVNHINPDGASLYVVNGDWDLTLFNNGKGIVHGAPGGDTECLGYKIVFTGYLPKDIGDYNAVIRYMDKQVAQGKLVIAVSSWYHLQASKVRKFTSAFKKAINAFRNEYRPKKVYDFDDDIPF